jgi:hypothetical protein
VNADDLRGEVCDPHAIVKRLAIVARLKTGAQDEASKLIAEGPPFELGETELERHSVYLSRTEVVFLFEGPDVEWLVTGMTDGSPTDPFHWTLQAAFDRWRPLVEGQPQVAWEQYFWARDDSQSAE